MESNYNNENFERFLRESTDQYRMYASENVWKNIYSYLHTRRRWFGIGLILLLSAGFVTTVMLTNSSVSGNHQVAEKKTPPVVKKQSTDNTTEAENLILTPYSTNKLATKDKPSLLQTLAPSVNITPDESSINSPNTNLTASAFTGSIDKTATNLVIDGKNEIIAEQTATTIDVTPIEEAQSPILVKITDPVTDQDTWTTYASGLLNNNTPVIKSEIFKATSSSNRPLTIESVVNSYTRRNKKLSFQYYFTPTISYRKLSENKSYLRSQNPGTSVYGDINNAVTHKPDMGLEVGVNARYALNKTLKVRAGLQFNTSRYDIKAFSYSPEWTTIALNTGYTVDSLSTVSNYRNFNGYRSDWLHNFYFQISMPIGIEVKLAGDDKVQFGVASTLQPTYILGDRAYLLSSNYKNYAEVPGLIRHWNLNTSLEAFVSYSTGKMNWQIGPQVRYQLYSSYVKKYPVKEHLFDFGLKIGVSPNR